MGLVSDAFDFVGDVVEFGGDIVGAGIDFVGDAIVGGRDFVEDIFDTGSGYQPGKSDTEEHTKKLANDLEEIKAQMRERSEKAETGLLQNVDESMDSYLRELKKLNRQSYGGASLQIDIEGIVKERERLESKVKGHIGRVLDQRLVLTDPELSQILKIDEDEERWREYQKFVREVWCQALESLQEKIVQTVDAQSRVVIQEIETRAKEVDQQFQETRRAYSDMLKVKKQSGSRETKKKESEYLYQCELYSLLLEQLEER